MESGGIGQNIQLIIQRESHEYKVFTCVLAYELSIHCVYDQTSCQIAQSSPQVPWFTGDQNVSPCCPAFERGQLLLVRKSPLRSHHTLHPCPDR